MAPFSPASGVPDTSPRTVRSRTQAAALAACLQAPVLPSAHPARPVLLLLLASVAGPPPKLPLVFWFRLSQPAASEIAALTALDFLGSAFRFSRASAVTSVSGA